MTENLDNKKLSENLNKIRETYIKNKSKHQLLKYLSVYDPDYSTNYANLTLKN